MRPSLCEHITEIRIRHSAEELMDEDEDEQPPPMPKLDQRIVNGS